MSKRQSKTGVQHLVYQAKTGFQFYFTFPSNIGSHPKLPAQIRWSLGHDEALARDLAKHLNEVSVWQGLNNTVIADKGNLAPALKSSLG